MSVTICKNNHLLGVVVSGIMLFLPMSASAKCGGVDYSWGADALANAHDYTVVFSRLEPTCCSQHSSVTISYKQIG